MTCVDSVIVQFSSVQFSPSVVSDSFDPMDCSTSGLPVNHQLPESNQTHVCWVGDAIQPFHPLSSPSPAFNLSQHHSLFKWVSSSHEVAKVLEYQLQHQPSSDPGLISFRMDLAIISHKVPISCREPEEPSFTRMCDALSLSCFPTNFVRAYLWIAKFFILWYYKYS